MIGISTTWTLLMVSSAAKENLYVRKRWLLNIKLLTLINLMDYPLHIGTISMELSILYFKGLPIKFL